MMNRIMRVTMKTKRPLRVLMCLLLVVSLMASAAPLFASPANSGTDVAGVATEDVDGRSFSGGWGDDMPILSTLEGVSIWQVRNGFSITAGEPWGTRWYIWHSSGEGATVTLQMSVGIIPRGYRFAGWEATPSIELSSTEIPFQVRFLMPEEDLRIVPIFEPAVPAENYRDVTVVNGSLISGGITTEIGSVVTVRGDRLIIPPGYRRLWVPSVPVEFLGNAAEAQGRSWTAQFIMPDTDVTLTYVVEPIPPELLRSLTKIVDDGSHGSPHIKTAELEYGTWINLINHNPPEGYRFVRWDWCTPVTYYNVSEKVRKFLMPDRDITITAVFEPGEGEIIDPIDPYHREVNITGGTVTGGNIHEIGSEVEVIAQVPGPDYQFMGWEIEGLMELIPTDNPLVLRFIMPETDVNINAVFERVVEDEIEVTLDSIHWSTNTLTPIVEDIYLGTVVVGEPTDTLHYHFFVTNRGTVDTGPVTVALIGADADSFILEHYGPSMTGSGQRVGQSISFANIPPGELASCEYYGVFDITLAAASEVVGLHSATVTVTTDGGEALASFNISYRITDEDVDTIMVGFDLNGGSCSYHGEIDIILNLPSGQAIGTANIPVPTRPFHHFRGWQLGGEGEVFICEVVAARVVNEPVIFTAVWELYQNNVTFSLDGGTSSTPLSVSIPHGSEIGLSNVPVPTRGGDTFLGWQRDGTGPILSRIYLSLMEVTEDMSFTATWSAASAEIIFELNGGTYNNSTNRVVRQGTLNQEIGAANVPSPTRGECTPLGWQRDGVGPVLSPEAVAGMTVESSKLFVALWPDPGVEITFNLNGGTFNGSSEPITVDVPYGTMITLPNVPRAERSNHDLVGWQIDGTGQVFYRAEVAQMNVTSPITFVAVWTAYDYFVVFDLNGGTVDGNTANVERLVNHGETLGAAVPVLDDDTNFLGWRNPATGVIYTSAEVAALEITAPIAFVAVWDTEVVGIHSITFNLAGGHLGGNTSNIVLSLEENSFIGLSNVPVPSRLNYNFLGWQRESTVGAPLTRAQVALTSVTQAMTFIAVWSPIEHQVQFDLNGGVVSTSSNDIVMTVLHGETIDTVPAPTHPDGLNLTGWWRERTGETLLSEDVALLPITYGETFVAQWGGDEHAVTFNLAGGIVGGSSSHVTVMVETGSPLSLGNVPTPTHPNRYTFLGWRLNDTGNLLTASQISNMVVTAPLTFVAQWNIPATEDHEIWFDLNQGNVNGNTEDIRILRASGEAIGVDAVPLAPQRANHTFLGWRLNGTGAILSRELVGAKEVNGLKIFSAAWERHRHPVIFQMSQMDSLANVHLSIEHGERVGPDSIPATNQAGYEFRGWRLNGEGELLTNAQVAATDIVGPTTFTAFWESTGNNNQPGGNQTPGTGGGGNNQTPGAGGGNNQPPAGGGNNQPPAAGGGTGPTAPQTGDENGIGLWLLLAILSLAAVIMFLVKRVYDKKRLVKAPRIMFDNDARQTLEEVAVKEDSFLEGWKR